MLSVIMLSVSEYRYATITLSFIIPIVVILNVVTLNMIRLSIIMIVRL
jgi:hypothetical protein